MSHIILLAVTTDLASQPSVGAQLFSMYICENCEKRMIEIIDEPTEYISDSDVDDDEWVRGTISKEWIDSKGRYKMRKNCMNIELIEGMWQFWDIYDKPTMYICFNCQETCFVECCDTACIIFDVESIFSNLRLDVSFLNIKMVDRQLPLLVDHPIYSKHFEKRCLTGPDGGYTVHMKCNKCQNVYSISNK